MTTFDERPTDATVPADGRLTLAEILEIFASGTQPLKFTAYDGSWTEWGSYPDLKIATGDA